MQVIFFGGKFGLGGSKASGNSNRIILNILIANPYILKLCIVAFECSILVFSTSVEKWVGPPILSHQEQGCKAC